MPFPSPGDLPDPGFELASLLSPAFAGGFFTTSATWEAPIAIYATQYQNIVPLGLLLKESYMAQNRLGLKLPSRSSPPFYAKQRTLSPEEKNGH